MRTIQQGSRGEPALLLQLALNARGFGRIEPDGIFGEKTRKALIQYQASEGLKADGVAGEKTWTALFRAMLRASPTTPTKPPEVADQDLATFIRALPQGPRRAVLMAALADVGKVEVPLGSNSGPQIAHLVEGYPYGDDPAWCGIGAMSWIAIGLGLCSPLSAAETNWSKHPFGDWIGAVAVIEDIAEARGWSKPIEEAKPGDLFTMAREGGGHTGFIVWTREGKAKTIEGNASDGVRSRLRDLATLRMAIDWTPGVAS